MEHKGILRQALLYSSPVFVGYVMIGFGFGIVLRDAGYGLPWAIAMSLFIYAGSMQFVGVSLITAPASLLTAALTTLMINARHLFYAISMIGRYRNTGKRKPYLVFALTDETYALLSGPLPCQEAERPRFCFWVSLFNHSYWILGTVLGSLAGASLPFDTRGIDFSMTALFAAAYTEQFFHRSQRLSSLLGLGITLLSLVVFGQNLFLIPAMVGITAALLLLRPVLAGKEEASDD